MTLHYAPTTPEEEELALALALSASLAPGKASGPSILREDNHSFTSSQSSRSNFSPSSSSGGLHPSPPAPYAPSTVSHAPPAAQRPTPVAQHRTVSPQRSTPTAEQQPATAARPPSLPPGLGSPPHIFPKNLPLPTPRLPASAASRVVPQHQRSCSALPLAAAPPPGQQPPGGSQHARSNSSASPPRSRFAWRGDGPGSPKAGASAAGPAPPLPLGGRLPPPPAVPAVPAVPAPGGQPAGPHHQPGGRDAGTHPVQPTSALPLPPVAGRSKSASGPSGMLSASTTNGGGSGASGTSGRGASSGGGGGSSDRFPGGSGSGFGSLSGGGGGRGSSGGGHSAGGAGAAAGGCSGGGCTPPPRVGTAAPASPPEPPAPQLYSDPNACAGCGRGFGLFSTDCITGMGRKWHAGCFRCAFCSEPISVGRGSFTYNMHPGDPRPYHPDCYRHAHHPVCTVCGTYIAPGPDGRITYRENGFWRQRYCSSHPEAGLTRCCACSRLQQQGEEWAPLPDGRPLCLQCLSGTVLDTREAQPLYEEVLRFYADEMRLPHPYKPPLLLVDGPTLNQHAAAEGRDDSEGAPVFHVRGLCVAQVYSHIPAILRGLGGGLRTVATALSPASSPTAAAATAPQRAHCHVSVLLLLYGLPRLLSGSIMAHELMHAWLRMAGLVGLPLRAEEGLCQLMACLWLDRQHELLHGNPDEQRLASFFSYQIRTDTSEVYGDGFREAMEAFQTYGLSCMIQNLKMYGRYTPP